MVKFNSYRYCPILCVRPAEMVALGELPEKNKDIMLPVILLRPWVNSARLQNTFDKIHDSVGNRPWIADIDNLYERGNSVEREVHKELAHLKISDSGYRNWCDTIKGLENVIPTLQLDDPKELEEQIDYFLSLNRGMVVRFTPNVMSRVSQVLAVIASKQVQNLCVILDYEHMNVSIRRDVNLHAAQVIALLRQVSSITPSATAAVSTTSFPSSFDGLSNQEIYERTLYKEVEKHMTSLQLVYSDRGSARAERMGGGGNAIPPRIDYPTKDTWYFVRKDDDKEKGYKDAANDVMKASYWNMNLDLWGTKMIEAAAGGDKNAIKSPARVTAVRINIHLHQQLFYNHQEELLDTDDDWTDD